MSSVTNSSNHLVIFTPHALIIDNRKSHSPTDISNAFSEWLAGKAQRDLDLFSVATKSIGGADLDETFENFLQALEVADCAIIVIPGQQICLLDAIYPRLLVHLTFRPWWSKRMLLVSLGEIAKNGKKFDAKIFNHPPVIFPISPSSWEKEVDQWKIIAEFIHPTVTEEETASKNPEGSGFSNFIAIQPKSSEVPVRNMWGKFGLATTTLLLLAAACFFYKTRSRT
ncbi:unnamed protein product [Rodentolepis nana]|uniref:NAD(P)-bd_dom domain-containing protein n=1 Tax=Rodentolepis nana TaxID=102285 RepID=A0A158QH19_RODNA|nr:unnamed protein product [Rodentolepis nana]